MAPAAPSPIGLVRLIYESRHIHPALQREDQALSAPAQVSRRRFVLGASSSLALSSLTLGRAQAAAAQAHGC